MIRFKQYLKEGPPAWTESLSTMIFDLPRAGLKDIKIPLHTETEIHRFEQSVSQYFRKMLLNKSQIRTLEKLRDTLLPKLMSGEVRVN